MCVCVGGMCVCVCVGGYVCVCVWGGYVCVCRGGGTDMGVEVALLNESHFFLASYIILQIIIHYKNVL